MERRLRGVAATRSQGQNPRQSYQMAIFEVSSVGGGRTARAPTRPAWAGAAAVSGFCHSSAVAVAWRP
ncbi:hypothetical protein AQ883_15235 [Burkholderia pseudomallei]|nr:hypothetical protein SY87_18680 [Burkholderia pseudomallei]KIX56762.1 hypothetical protein SZ29_18970 [Burkholderia pseudomallei]KIX66264.1 hypothetical protein SZ30_19410 [Burkholderia pseudomallei]KNA34373.1 hypothetical protein ADU20_11845 [Burkholderia pseudomallei]OMS27406.1 hypothetical protein AQ739_18405 [Burkholderia pseudomallei]